MVPRGQFCSAGLDCERRPVSNEPVFNMPEDTVVTALQNVCLRAPASAPGPERRPEDASGVISVAAAAGVLSGCGGGASSPSPAPAPAPAAAPAPGNTAATPTLAEAARFLAQATTGAPKSEAAAVLATSFSAWIDNQMALPRSQSHVDWLVAKGFSGEAFRNNAQGLDQTLWRKLIASPDSLRQRVTLALSEVLVVSVLGVSAPFRQFAVASYVDILEAHAFGSFRALLEQVSLSSAMGYYLTYRGNVKANLVTGSQPDENYARELMQLFTIGLVELNGNGTPKLLNGQPQETYTQDDVSGLARVFTGWELDTAGLPQPLPHTVHLRPMVQVASRYETGAKSFLGLTIPSGTPASTSLQMALDLLFNHANCAPFIGRQLIQRLVTSNPSPDYIGRVAAAFANNGAGIRGDLKSVVRAVLLDPEARDATKLSDPAFGRVREPMVRFLNWARAFGATSPSDAWAIGDLSDPASRLAQSPMRSPSVFNFFRPGFVPAGTAFTSQSLTAPELQITTESSVAGYINYMQRAIAGTGIGDVRGNYQSLLTLVADSGALLDEINLVLAAGQVSSATLTKLRQALDTVPITTEAGKLNRVHAALTLVMASPEYIVQK